MANTLFDSVYNLTNILILDTFFILIYATFGLAIWGGVSHYKCRQTKYPENGDWKVIEDDHHVCGAFHQCEIACGSLFELNLENENGTMTQYHINESIPLTRDSTSVY